MNKVGNLTQIRVELVWRDIIGIIVTGRSVSSVSIPPNPVVLVAVVSLAYIGLLISIRIYLYVLFTICAF